jgi:ATP-dependent Clp protease ATP-binding subunit ClpC
MFERFTDSARRVLFFARYEVGQLGSQTIETEHLLLGLVREPKGIAARVLSTPPLSVAAIRAEIGRRTADQPRERTSTSVEIPFSDECRNVLEHAAREADGLGHAYVGVEHLLLGLLSEERSVAGSILAGLGADLESIRETVRRMSEHPSPPLAATHLPDDVIQHLKTLVSELEQAPEPEARAGIARMIQKELDTLRDRFLS